MLASCLMRRALPEDAAEVAYLEMKMFPENCFNEYTLRQEFKYSSCWVIEGPVLRGYLITRVDGDLVDIMRVAVREEYQGMMLGFRLMNKALSLAPRATLMVRKDNERALRLYLGLGFRIAGEFEQSWMMLTSESSGKRLRTPGTCTPPCRPPAS